MRRPDNRNYLAIDSNTEIGITTQEKFITHLYASTGVITRPLAVGVCYEFSVPALARTHHIWIAAGAYRTTVASDQWFVQGSLNFFRGGRHVGRTFFGDRGGSIQSGFVANKSTRLLLRTRGDASGSTQPVLRYQVYDATIEGAEGGDRDNLDIPCFSLGLQCDKITYEIESYWVDNPPVGGVSILTGTRIISLP